MRQDLQTVRTDNSALDATCHDRDKTIHQLKTRLAVLEQSVRDKEDVVSRTSLMLQATTEQKVKAEGLLEQRDRDVVKSESTVKSLSSEVMKGNEIIQRLQSELKSYKDKVSLRTIVDICSFELFQIRTRVRVMAVFELKPYDFIIVCTQAEEPWSTPNPLML